MSYHRLAMMAEEAMTQKSKKPKSITEDMPQVESYQPPKVITEDLPQEDERVEENVLTEEQ